MLATGLRLLASLAVVVGLLLIIAKMSARRFGGRTGATVEVLARQAISRGSGVAVVRVGSRVLVLGATEQHVSLLTEVDPEEVLSPAAAVHDAADDDHDDHDDYDDYDDYDTTDGIRDIGDPDDAGASVTDFGELVARARRTDTSPLAGSILSPQTWRQALSAVSRTGASMTGERRTS